MFFLAKQNHKLYFNINYIINLINRKFLFEIYLEIKVKRILSLIIIKSLNINIYNINQYINQVIYLLNKNNIKIILIERKFYIINNLIIKIFIDIDILKPEKMIFNIIRDVIIITSYKNLEILIIFNN